VVTGCTAAGVPFVEVHVYPDPRDGAEMECGAHMRFLDERTANRTEPSGILRVGYCGYLLHSTAENSHSFLYPVKFAALRSSFINLPFPPFYGK
jgi:hypothetical protein